MLAKELTDIGLAPYCELVCTIASVHSRDAPLRANVHIHMLAFVLKLLVAYSGWRVLPVVSSCFAIQRTVFSHSSGLCLDSSKIQGPYSGAIHLKLCCAREVLPNREDKCDCVRVCLSMCVRMCVWSRVCVYVRAGARVRTPAWMWPT